MAGRGGTSRAGCESVLLLLLVRTGGPASAWAASVAEAGRGVEGGGAVVGGV